MKASIFNVLGGQGGTKFIESTTDHNDEEFLAIVVLQDSVFDELWECNKQGSESITELTDVRVAGEQNVQSLTIPAGAILYPKKDLFRRVQLNSGSAVALRA